jgi:hypothetical protein
MVVLPYEAVVALALVPFLCQLLTAGLILKTANVKAICRGPAKPYGIHGHCPLGSIGE